MSNYIPSNDAYHSAFQLFFKPCQADHIFSALLFDEYFAWPDLKP